MQELFDTINLRPRTGRGDRVNGIAERKAVADARSEHAYRLDACAHTRARARTHARTSSSTHVPERV
eukprot:6202208-Pleurochrysis_carterae.AAC.2